MHYLEEEIDKMFITSVITGKIIHTGSFWAEDSIEQKYFANSELVNGKIQTFKELQLGKQKTILVLKEIWTGKWNNQEVNKIIFIGNDLNETLNFKRIITNEIRTMIKQNQIFEHHLEKIKNGKCGENDHNYLNEEKELQRELQKIREEKTKMLTT
jgi:hypothetical protein